MFASSGQGVCLNFVCSLRLVDGKLCISAAACNVCTEWLNKTASQNKVDFVLLLPSMLNSTNACRLSLYFIIVFVPSRIDNLFVSKGYQCE